VFNRITAVDSRGRTYTEIPGLGRKDWLILGTLFSRPFQPVPYEELAVLIGQDPSVPVHLKSNGSRVYNAVYSIRRHLAHAHCLDRIVRLAPWPSAPQGGYMFMPSQAGRK
jgi:hypothetical protein